MKNIMTDTFPSNVTAPAAVDMIEIGRNIASRLSPGSTIALTGSLGAGKTTLVKGIAKGLSIKDEITSPSFTIIKEYYDGSLPLYHMDLYRIDNLEELYLIGVEELIYGDGISIIEWSEKAEELLPENTIRADIRINQDGSRSIQFEGLT